MSLRRLFLALLLVGPAVILTMPGCAVCKSSDSVEVCRTKQRDHNQPRIDSPWDFLGRRP